MDLEVYEAGDRMVIRRHLAVVYMTPEEAPDFMRDMLRIMQKDEQWWNALDVAQHTDRL